MAQALRYDVGTLAKASKTPQGFLRADATITRTGVFSYRLPDGKVRKELRLPEEVFKQDALDSFAGMPVTDEHPPKMLTAENAGDYARGHLGDDVKRAGDHVVTKMLVTDAGLIAKMEAGEKRQLSCGYACELDETPGEYGGEKYDAVQRDIRGNHVAVVKVGRAGPSARVHMDAAEMVEDEEGQRGDAAGANMNEKVVISGVTYEVSAQVAQALAAQNKSHADALARETARADAASAELAKSEKARKDAEDGFDARVKSRAELLAVAAKHGVEKADAMSDRDVKLAVCEKLECKLDAEKAKSDAYLDASYDIVVRGAGKSAMGKVREQAGEGARADSADAAKKAEEAHRQGQKDRWKKLAEGKN